MNLKKKSKVNPKEVLKEYQNMSDKIQHELIEEGVHFFDTPTANQDYLDLPAEITETPLKELGEYLNAFTQQKIYMRTLLGRAETLREEARKLYADVSASVYPRYNNSKYSEKAKEREINSLDEVKDFYDRYSEIDRRCAMIEYNIADIEDVIFLLSREISRRMGDFSNETRNYNIREGRVR